MYLTSDRILRRVCLGLTLDGSPLGRRQQRFYVFNYFTQFHLAKTTQKLLNIDIMPSYIYLQVKTKIKMLIAEDQKYEYMTPTSSSYHFYNKNYVYPVPN